MAEKFKGQFACTDSEPGLKNAKLGIEEIGVANSSVFDPPLLRKENTPDPKQGVDGSTRKEENEDLHVNTGDWASSTIGDPAPKLMS